MDEFKELIPFNNSCQELIMGKYLLADIKIGSILKIIDNDEKLKNIVSACMADFDFLTTFNASITKNNEQFYLTLPTEEKNIIAFVYSILSAVKNGSINFDDFITKFYSNDSTNNVLEFANNVIVPFKNAINSMYSKTHVIKNTNDYQNNIYNKLKTNIGLIISNLDNYKLKITEKEEFTMLLNSLYTASEKNDKNLVYSLMIGLDYFSKASKRVRNAYLSLEECFS